jgi:N-acetylglucosaminyldiphosphoundecaprenol N-acetyl-beta-D-mannosaminyltransferase
MEILGVKIDNLNEQEVFDRIEGFLTDGGQHYIVLPYSEFIVRANQDESFKRILNQADLSLCDGQGLRLMTRLLGCPLKEQIAGVELTRKICERYPVFLFGGKTEVVKKTAALFASNVLGWIDGYQDQKEVIQEINQVKPKIILVALGSPKQEEWISDNLGKTPSVKLAIGVGGAFDFISGRIHRAPRFLRSMGLEWSWRLIRQPWRIKRVFNAVMVFPWLIFRSKK